MKIDLLLLGGTLIDPAQEIKKQSNIAVDNGKIIDVDFDSSYYSAKQSLDISGKLVMPGLIDLHTHLFYGGTPIGVNIDLDFKANGVTTFVDAGSAGAGNYPIFHDAIISKSKYRIFSFLNIYYPGLVNTSHWLPRHDRNPIHYASIPALFETINNYSESIVGIKVMASSDYNYHGLTALRMGIEAGKQINKPLMVHFSSPPVFAVDILPLLNPGDILTHSFRGEPNSCITKEGVPLKELISAQKRGVIIDIGHGEGSFSIEVAKKMLDNGFYPDVISSDMHINSIKGPAYNLPTTMSKFLSLGMDLLDVVKASTWTPAQVIGKKNQLGTLEKGSVADLAVFELVIGEFDYYDAIYEGANVIRSNKFIGNKSLKNIMTILKGKVIS